ncbi:hypothetical protein BD560DRAFT_429054 [Blakeslea trispora]|nr:hypothetical protein BD560DRAFT_429054 [Blakeslea trispora]
MSSLSKTYNNKHSFSSNLIASKARLYSHYTEEVGKRTMIFTEHTSASYGTYLALPIYLPSWKPGFETHLFHTTANKFQLMHSLPRRQMNHGYCPISTTANRLRELPRFQRVFRIHWSDLIGLHC